MIDRPNRFDDKDRPTDELAPETENAEQDEDAEEQAQTVTEEARNRATGQGLKDSEKVNSGDPSDDEQDLVDRMRQMDRSGRIDMDAFEGEPNHDDDVDKYGPDKKVDPLRGDGT